VYVAPQKREADKKRFIENVFEKLRDQFPDDVRLLSFGSSAMCVWPDFGDISWFEPDITVPLLGALNVQGLSFVYTEEFLSFFPPHLFSAFNDIQACILPPYTDGTPCNALLRSLAVKMRVPSIEFSCRNSCSVVAVLSCVDCSTLTLQSACSLLPAVGPRLTEKLLCPIIRMYKDSMMERGTSSALLKDAATSSALLAVLKRYIDLSAAHVATAVASAPSSSQSASPYAKCEIDAQDYLGKWYQAFIVEGDVSSSDAIRVHFMVRALFSQSQGFHLTVFMQGWSQKWDENIPKSNYATHIRPRSKCLTGPHGEESLAAVQATYSLTDVVAPKSSAAPQDACSSGLEQILNLIKICAQRQPLEVVRCSISESLFALSMTAAAHRYSALLLDIIDILAASACALPETPAHPKDVLDGSAVSNWPCLFKTQIALMQESGLHTFDDLVDSMLLGKSAFRARTGKLSAAASRALLTSLTFHFRRHYASRVYCDAVTRFCAALSDTPHKPQDNSDYSADVLASKMRCMLLLLFRGQFRYEFILPCASFLHSCSKLKNTSSEVEFLFTAFDKIVQSCIPALDPNNNQPFHVIWLPRTMLEFALNVTANAVSSISVDSMVFDAVSSIGWCSLRNYNLEDAQSRLPLYCGAVLVALRRNGEKLTLKDIAAASKVPSSEISSSLRRLSALGLVQMLSDGSAVACDTMYSEQFKSAHESTAAVAILSELDSTLEFTSPVLPATVEAYIRICHGILLRLLRCRNGCVESQLVADVAQQEGASCNRVQQCIYFLISRKVIRVVFAGSTHFVHLSVDHAKLPVAAALPLPSFDSNYTSFSFGSLDDVISKVVVFAPSGEMCDESAGETFLSMMLELHPASCCDFESKSSAEHYLTLVITQLQNTLDISFLLAAKELIQCHGFPEHVIIKFLDSSVYSSMFCCVESPPHPPCGSLSADAVVDVAAPDKLKLNCAVCLDNEMSLIPLPCGHLLCDECFTHCFLSDARQHIFGTLPEEQTPVAVCVDEDGDTPRRRDFFSCPTCNISLNEQFWDKFPQHLVEAQRQRPLSCHVTLDQVHHRIVANALRILRQDPTSTIARCEGSRALKGRYVACASATQAVTCMARAFDCIADFREFTDEEELPCCGLNSLQLSQWKNTMHEFRSELQKSEAPLLNAAGVAMNRSGQTGLLYCGRNLGRALIPGSDGRCGPNNGPQCSDCKGFVNTDHLQPTFVADGQRKTSPEDMLRDIRMCPRCFGGYFINTNCSALGQHHGEMKDGMHVQNVCRDCGFFSGSWSDWPIADERLKAQKIKAQLPFLKSVVKALNTIQSLLSLDFAIDKASILITHSSQLLKNYCCSRLDRRVIRSRLITMMRTIVCAALDKISRAANCSLSELNAEGKHTVLVLQLLQVAESFAKPYLSSVPLLSGSTQSSSYALSAVLLSFAAVETWSTATLDNFITGNVGTTSTAPSYIKSLLDSAASSITACKTPFASPRSTSEAVALYRFSFDGAATHDQFIAERIHIDLDSSILFNALEKAFGLKANTAAMILMRHVPLKELLQLLATSDIVSAISALLPFILPSHFSFQQNRAAIKTLVSSAAETDSSAIAAVVVADILNTKPLAIEHMRAVRFNQSRPVQVTAAPASLPSHPAAAHVSVDAQGCVYACGIISNAIRVFDRDGGALSDLHITQLDQHVAVQTLRATAHDRSTGNIYVSDTAAAVVYCINKHGHVLFTSAAGVVCKPQGLSLCSRTRRVAVADGDSLRILRSSDLSLVKILSRSSVFGRLTDDSQFQSCCDVAFDANGFLYAVDGGANRVMVFDCSFVNVATFGSHGSDDGQFDCAQGVCVDGTGKVFVSDSTRVQMFHRQGGHVVSLLLSSFDKKLTWSRLGGIAIDTDGRLLVCSQGTNSLLRIL
jgi:DNA-binding beta-propeller fold protein YncE